MDKHVRRGPARRLVAALLLGVAGAARAAVGLEVQFNDPAATYASYYADIERMVRSTGADWLSRFAAPAGDITLDVQISFAGVPTANGSSATSAFLRTTPEGIDVFEQGAAYKLRTGIDANGAEADIGFTVGINGYLQNELWFDPDPVAQTAVVPVGQTDARSVFLHEFGHAFGFNGWRNGIDGELPGDFMSTFDALTALAPGNVGSVLYFNGPAATALYGGPVPLTFGNYSHVGNDAPQSGADLVGDLMNGVVFFRGSRYRISELDMAIMQDIGLPVQAVPEPATVALMLAGLVLLGRRGGLVQRSPLR